jgi:hypothetical protein
MKAFLLIALAAFALVGCVDQKDWLQKSVPKDDDAFARRFLDSLRQARYEEVDSMLEPNVAEQAGASGIAQLHQVLDHGEPLSFETIGWNALYLRPFDQSKPPTRNITLDYQLHFREAWIVAEVVLTSSDGGNRVREVHLQPIPDSLEVLNRFTLHGKGSLHFVVLAMCVLVPLFVVATMIVCLFSRVRLRWLWALFIIVAFGQFVFNWSTGEWAFQPFTISLLGFGYWRSGLYAPWILKFSIPVGAILFLVLRRWLLRKDEPSALSTTATSA